MSKRLRIILATYKKLLFTAAGLAISGGLDAAKQDTTAHAVIVLVALVIGTTSLVHITTKLRDGQYGVDILSIITMAAAVYTKTYWIAGAVAAGIVINELVQKYAFKKAQGETKHPLIDKHSVAHVMKGRKVVDSFAPEVMVGDKLVIESGDIVPVDGILLEGSSEFDESGVTGELAVMQRGVGGTVLSGTINTGDTVTIQATHTAKESQYQRIHALVHGISASRAPFVKLTENFTIPFTLLAILIASAAWFLSGDRTRFVDVLVVATPFSLIFAAPVALVSGMSAAAKRGIIFKNAQMLEALSEVRSFAFDKTGTLTTGVATVRSVKAYGDHSEEFVIRAAAALEHDSSHPLAVAINIYAAEKDIHVKTGKHLQEISGQGVRGVIQGKQVSVGKLSLVRALDLTFPKNFDSSKIKHAATVVAIQNELVGVIEFNEAVRTDAKSTIERLRHAKASSFAVITGDSEVAALEVAKELDIADVYPECLPADKLHAVENIPQKPVAFVGDGVHDAPVLTAADVGIALGVRATPEATEAAQVVILENNFERVATAYEAARRSLTFAKQGIFISTLASIGLMGALSTGRFPALAGLAVVQVLHVLVILAALRPKITAKSLEK